MVEKQTQREKESTNWLMEQFKKRGWWFKGKTVYKVVARKDGREFVFFLPGYSPPQVERYLLYLGWEYVAGVQFDSPEEANDITPNEIKILGMKAQGEG